MPLFPSLTLQHIPKTDGGKWRKNLTCQNIYPLFWELTSNESKRTWMILIHCNNGEPVLTVLFSINIWNIWNDRFFWSAFPYPPPRYWERHIFMHPQLILKCTMKFHPAFILELLFQWLMSHCLGNCAAEERQGESKTHEIYLWGHFSLLLLSLLVPYYPICPVRECVIY